jgi:predicted Zn-dependent peptidase
MIVTVVGNVDVDKTIDLISEHFGKFERGFRCRMKTRHKVHPPYCSTHEHRLSDNTCQVALGWEIEGSDSYKDLKSIFVDDVVESMMFNGPMSKLYESVRTKHGLCYQIYGYFRRWRRKGLCHIAGSTAYENIDKFISLIKNELGNIKSVDDVLKAGFKNARTGTLNRFLMECDDLGSIVRNVWYLYRLNRKVDLEAVKDAIESVTPQDVLGRIRSIAVREPVVCTIINKR